MTTSFIDLSKRTVGSLPSGRSALCRPRRSSLRLANDARRVLAYAVDQPRNGATLEKESPVKTVSSMSRTAVTAYADAHAAFGRAIRARIAPHIRMADLPPPV